MPAGLEQRGADVLIRIKVVPGASRDEISGMVGERLKVRTSAPPEAGRANEAVCGIIARAIGVRPGKVAIEGGAASPEKTIRVMDVKEDDVRRRISETVKSA